MVAVMVMDVPCLHDGVLLASHVMVKHMPHDAPLLKSVVLNAAELTTCDAEFAQLFPATDVTHIMTEESDHLALIISVREEAECRPIIQRWFRYEEMWTRHEDYEAMVKELWEADGHKASDVTPRM